MVVQFETRKDGGRTVILEKKEAFCINCGLNRGDKPTEWYYFTGLPKGLFCRKCATDPSIRLTVLNENSIFWNIDNWEFVQYSKQKKQKR